MQQKKIKLSDLVPNDGQIAGLPANPRQWTRTELDKLKKSIKETPELLEARGILVYPYGDKYVILGGNMRRAALSELKIDEAPCIVVDEDTEPEKLRELVIKDNGSFGAWDWDMLANEWDDLDLASWGVPVWDTPQEEEKTDTPKDEKDLSDEIDVEYKIEVTCINESEQEALFNKLTEEGYVCRILTL